MLFVFVFVTFIIIVARSHLCCVVVRVYVCRCLHFLCCSCLLYVWRVCVWRAFSFRFCVVHVRLCLSRSCCYCSCLRSHVYVRDLSLVSMLFVFVLVVAAYSFSHVGARAHSFSCSLLARGDVGRARSRWFCSLLVVTLVLIVLFVFALVVR